MNLVYNGITVKISSIDSHESAVGTQEIVAALIAYNVSIRQFTDTRFGILMRDVARAAEPDVRDQLQSWLSSQGDISLGGGGDADRSSVLQILKQHQAA